MPGVRPGVLEASLRKRRPGSVVRASLSPCNYTLIHSLKRDSGRSFQDIFWFFFVLFLNDSSGPVNPIPEKTKRIAFRAFPEYRRRASDQAWFRKKNRDVFFDDLVVHVLSKFEYALLVRMLKDQADRITKVLTSL
jgi:hypothetical protein